MSGVISSCTLQAHALHPLKPARKPCNYSKSRLQPAPETLDGNPSRDVLSSFRMQVLRPCHATKQSSRPLGFPA